MSVNVGDEAPWFALPNPQGDLIGLDDYDGRYVLVWWLPSTLVEHCTGCSDRIANDFMVHLEDDQLDVLGLSFDNGERLLSFARRAEITFPMLTADIETATAYGVYRGDEDEWNCFPRKRAFLVAPNGRIAKVYLNIDPDFFVHEVIDDLNEIAPRKGGLFGRVLASLKG